MRCKHFTHEIIYQETGIRQAIGCRNQKSEPRPRLFIQITAGRQNKHAGIPAGGQVSRLFTKLFLLL